VCENLLRRAPRSVVKALRHSSEAGTTPNASIRAERSGYSAKRTRPKVSVVSNLIGRRPTRRKDGYVIVSVSMVTLNILRRMAWRLWPNASPKHPLVLHCMGLHNSATVCTKFGLWQLLVPKITFLSVLINFVTMSS
jgi:hypothetical protein